MIFQLNDRIALLTPMPIYRLYKKLRHPRHAYYSWRKWRALPAVGDMIYYHSETVTVKEVNENGDLLLVDGRNVDWMACCEPLDKTSNVLRD